MTTIVPIFIPSSEPAKCPHCGKVLPEETVTLSDILHILIGVVAVLGYLYAVVWFWSLLF